jgi:hypothetical protein
MKVKARSVGLVMLALGVLGTAARASNPGDPPGAPDDHFLFYKAKVTKGTTAFTSLTASLANALDPVAITYTVKKPVNLCTPASKNGGTVTDANTHLVSYSIKLPKGFKYLKQTNIKVVDQFSAEPALRVDTIKPDLLLVPSSKTLAPPPPSPPDLGAINVDHYLCYKIKVTKGTSKFVARTVSVADQFTTAKNFDLKKPKHLCVPTSVNGGAIKNAAGHLMCYLAKPSKGEPKHTKQTGVNVDNEFAPHPLLLDTVKEKELCAPAIINPICGDNVINDPSEQCDGSADAACPGQCTPHCACPTPHSFVIDPSSAIVIRGLGALDADFSLAGLSGTITFNTGGEITPGVLEVSVPVTSLPPLNIFGLATACVFLTEDPAMPGSGLSGTGVLNCYGTPITSPASPDFTVHQDHCTNGVLCDSHPIASPGCSTPLGPGKIHALSGLCVPEGPNDPTCAATDPLSGTTATLESGTDPHPGVCKSPLYGEFGSTSWNAGDAFVTLNATVEIRGPGDLCLGPPAGTAVKGPLTTGTAASTIMDAFPSTAPAAGKVQALAAKGTPFVCAGPLGTTLETTSGAVLVTAAPALDLNLPAPYALSDLNTTLILKAQ